MEKMILTQEVLCGLSLPLCAVGGGGGQEHPYLLPSSRPTEAINLSGWSASPHPHLPTQVHA